jgi:hypothetical protein
MLLDFTIGNYRSINDKCTLSMLAQGIHDEPKDNVVRIGKNNFLKTAAIYGANSSGKTNVVLAMGYMKKVIINSVKLNPNEELEYDHFLLTTEKNKPTFAEATFQIDNTIYRYGFELTSTSIVGEWLFKRTKTKEDTLFLRTKDGIGVNEKEFKEGIDRERDTNNNRLFLSLCGQLGGNESKIILNWFENNFNVISGIESSKYSNFSKLMFHENLEGCDNAKLFLEKLQLGFKELKTIEIEFSPNLLPKDMPDYMKRHFLSEFQGTKHIDFRSMHQIYDKNGEIAGNILFDTEKMESEGTKKLIQLSGPIFDTLKRGSILVVDELDAKMHPLLSQYIIELFNSSKTNINNAQLIFTTHDTHLLSSKLLRRDQIWFTEKDSKEQTDLYNMMDIILPDGTKPRNDANYERNYISGRYGAIPYIIND